MITLQNQMGYQFRNPDLLEKALTHKSFHNERSSESCGQNEKLEFLGDAVLDLVLSAFLMQSFPDLKEGSLSKLRASLVNEGILAKVAKELDLNELIRLSKGEALTGGSKKPRLLASAFEALMGAVFLDGGYEEVRRVVERIFAPKLKGLKTVSEYDQDYKTRLQEKLQELHQRTPSYQVKKEDGPDHDKIFVVDVNLADQVLASGEGKSKKQAEQNAACLALEKL